MWQQTERWIYKVTNKPPEFFLFLFLPCHLPSWSLFFMMLSSMRPSPEVSSVYIMLSSAAVIWQTHKLLCVYISKVKGMVGTCVAIENSLFMTLLFFSNISILVSWSNNKTYSDLTKPLSLMIMCVFFLFYKTCNINHTYFDLLFWGPNICGLSKSTFFFLFVILFAFLYVL